MTIIIFILVLLATVLVHEWGHFIVARKSGMTVEEFGFGIPPRIYAWKKGDTTYSINALPIGGFVKIAGENGLEDGSVAPVEKQFESKPWYLKSAVLIAGVVCNVLLAIVLFFAAYTIGIPVASEHGVATVVSVVPNSPAAQAGIGVGDVVTSLTVGSTTLKNSDITTEALHKAIIRSEDPVSMTYTHFKTSHTVTVVPTGTHSSRVIGLAIEPVAQQRLSVGAAFTTALNETWSMAGEIFRTLAALIGGIFHHNGASSSLVGPVGLAQEVGSAASIGFAYLLAFTAAISVNLAVINILPFPALDGGRLVVVLLEAVTRRKFSQNTVNIIHAIGFLLLLALMVVLTVGDVRRLL